MIRYLSILIALGMISFTATARDFSGQAQALDARTLEIDGNIIRIFGIEAPALDQTCTWSDKVINCGPIARSALMDLITGASVDCTVIEDRADNHPIIATCQVDGFDLGRNMVHTGWALADRNVAANYIETEDKARAAKRGLWRGKFLHPRIWRQSR